MLGPDTPIAARPAARSLGRFGKYELVGPLGAGGMATVYRAAMHGPGGATRHVALKLIHPHLSRDAEFVRLFLDEVRMAMAMSHRNIVQTFDAGTEGPQHYMVMELVAGASLRELMQRVGQARAVPLDVALFIAMEVCSALSYAHTFEPEISGQPGPVIHRDISPSNVLLSRNGDVKLADFGVARAMGVVAHSNSSDAVKGKMSYMAPEQARGLADPRSDLFAVGALLYELLTGRTIRRRASLEEVLEGPIELVPVSACRADAPEALDTVIARCLARDPEKRPPTADRLRQAFGAIHYELSRRPTDPHKQLAQLVQALPPPPKRAASAARLAAALLAEAGAIETDAGIEAPPGRDAVDTAPGPLERHESLTELTVPLVAVEPTLETSVSLQALAERELGARRDASVAETSPSVVVAAPTEIVAPPPRSASRANRRALLVAAVVVVLASAVVIAWLIASAPMRGAELSGSSTITGSSSSATPGALAGSAAPSGPAAGSGAAAVGSAAAASAGSGTSTGSAAAARSGSASAAAAGSGSAAAAAGSGSAAAAAGPGSAAAAAGSGAASAAAAGSGSASAARSAMSARVAARADRGARPRVVRRHRPRRVGFGYLSLNASPWARVTIDGKLRGHTPLQGLRLRAGRHRVRLYNPDRRLSRTLTIVLRVGERKTRVVRLR